MKDVLVPYFRAGLQRVLSRSGYRVDTAANGRDALKTFSEAPGRIDLVITD
jgi:DNA-binding response OmpR family regulator